MIALADRHSALAEAQLGQSDGGEVSRFPSRDEAVLGTSTEPGHHPPSSSAFEDSGTPSAGQLDRRETLPLALYDLNPCAACGALSAAQGKAVPSMPEAMSLGAIAGDTAAQPRTPSQRAACNEAKHAPAQEHRKFLSGRGNGVSEEVESNDESHSTTPQLPQPGYAQNSSSQPLSLAQCWSIPFPDSSVVGMSPRRFASAGAVDSAQRHGSSADPAGAAASTAAADLSPPWSPRRVPPAFAWGEGPPRMPGYRSGGASLPDVAPAGYNGHVSAARLVEAASQLQALMDCRAAAGLGPVARSPPFFASPAAGAAPSPFERLRFPAGGAAARQLRPETPAAERADSCGAAGRGPRVSASPDVARVAQAAGPESSGATFGVRQAAASGGSGGCDSSPPADEDCADEVSSPLTPVHDCRLHLRLSDVSGHANVIEEAAGGAAQQPPATLPATCPAHAPSMDMTTSSSERRRSSSSSERPSTKRRLF